MTLLTISAEDLSSSLRTLSRIVLPDQKGYTTRSNGSILFGVEKHDSFTRRFSPFKCCGYENRGKEAYLDFQQAMDNFHMLRSQDEFTRSLDEFQWGLIKDGTLNLLRAYPQDNSSDRQGREHVLSLARSLDRLKADYEGLIFLQGDVSVERGVVDSKTELEASFLQKQGCCLCCKGAPPSLLLVHDLPYDRVVQSDIIGRAYVRATEAGRESESIRDFFERNGIIVDSQTLGTGGFGSVFPGNVDRRSTLGKAMQKQGFIPGPCAVKILPQKTAGLVLADYLSNIRGEALSLVLKKNRNLLNTFGIITRKTDSSYRLITGRDKKAFLEGRYNNEILVAVVSELVSDSHELYDYIVGNSLGNVPSKKKVFKAVLSSVKELHKQNIMHRDLKPENILLKLIDPTRGLLEIKIIDFGLMRQLSGGSGAKTFVGTLNYLAPEILLNVAGSGRETTQEYDLKCDNWSLGCILFEMLRGTQLFNQRSPISVIREQTGYRDNYNRIRNIADLAARRTEFNTLLGLRPGVIDDQTLDLLYGLLDPNPHTRITSGAALSHPALSGLGSIAIPRIEDALLTGDGRRASFSEFEGFDYSA